MRRIRYSLAIGEHLKQARRDAGLTQTQLAELSGLVTSTNICGYERGRRTPDLSTIILLLRGCKKQLAIVDLEDS